MKKMLLAAGACLLAVAPAAALEQRDATHATPPIVPHPMPQGVPYLVVGESADPILELRYGVVNGKRVLLNAHTLEVVYILHP